MRVSVTQGGLTTFTRIFSFPSSSAAARPKPSNPALTMLMAAAPGIGSRQHAASDRNRAARTNVLRTHPHDIHLPHELVVKAFLEVGVGERGERLEHCAPRRADDGVHLANRRERLFERGLVCNVRAVVRRGPRDRDNFMLAA